MQVGAQEFTSLIDSGSTHNFFSHKAAQAANIQFQADTGARVVVANGDSVPCGGIARDIDIKIGQEIFNINAYSLPLDCFDMVLGVDLLKPLHSILIDFDDLVMAFTYNGKRVFWKGLGSSRSDIPSTGRLHSIRQ
jgi:predicted aspartyl protease